MRTAAPRCVLAGLLALTSLSAQTATPATSGGAADSAIKLDDFVVTAAKATGYRATTAGTATGIGTRISETPLAISIVTDQLIADTAGFEVREALNFVPGVLTNPRSESTFVVRGFGGNISYRNGQYRRQLLTTWNIDQVEVIKGPAAIFFGAVRPGGIVNYLTKKPVLTGDFTEVNIAVGNEGFYKGEFYHNQKINDKLAIRVGAGGITSGGERPFEYKRENYTGASLLWKPTENQQLTFDAEAINRKVFYLSSYPVRALANSKVYGAAGAIAAQAALNRQSTTADTANRNYLTTLGFSGTIGASNFYPLYDMFAPYDYTANLSNDAWQKQRSNAFDLDYLLKLNDHLVWQTTLNMAFDDTDGLQPSDGDVRPYADGSLRFRTEYFINVRFSRMAHNKLTWRFDLGPTNHTVQFGQDYQYVLFRRPGYLNAANQYNDSPGNTGSSAINPYVINFIPGVTAPVSLAQVFANSGQTFNIVRDRWEQNYGYFLVDQMKFLNDRVFTLAGIRYNRFTGKIKYDKPVSNSSQSAANGGLANYDVVGSKGGWTPQLGAIVKVVPGLSAFATYSKSIEPNFSLDADGVSSEPVESESWDFGLKTELLGGRLTSTLAYYDSIRGNLAYRDTDREIATGRSPFFIFGNEESSKGLEFDANWAPTDNYQLMFGWSHVTEAMTKKSNDTTIVGRRFGGVPPNTYSLWNRYDFKTGDLKGLTLGFGVRHNDATNLSQSQNNVVVLPSFTVFDAMVAYKLPFKGRDLKAQLNVKNLTDKLYREGADGYFGQTRTIYLSLATRF
jgi:iron complex outermembrane recepter protein